MIKSENIIINKPNQINTETILKELNLKNIVPIRWAVTGIEDDKLILTVSYLKK